VLNLFSYAVFLIKVNTGKENPEEKTSVGRSGCRWQNVIELLDWLHLNRLVEKWELGSGGPRQEETNSEIL